MERSRLRISRSILANTGSLCSTKSQHLEHVSLGENRKVEQRAKAPQSSHSNTSQAVVEDPLHFKLVALTASARGDGGAGGGRTFSLRAENQHEKDIWVAKLRSVCGGVDEVE